MAEMILVKVAPLTKAVTEVMIPMGSTVQVALSAAASNGAAVSGYSGLHKNGKEVSVYDIVNNGDIITLIPAIKGGNI